MARQVLITGGTGGLGVSVTTLALIRGWHVTVPYKNQDELTRLNHLNEELRSRLTTTPADLTDEAQVAAIADSMERVDALVHLVGGFTMGPTHLLSLDGWRAHHDLVLTSTFLCCKHAMRRMVDAGHGRIVTIGSRAVERPMAKTAAYSAAKAGVVALTRVIAEETKGTDVTAACVMPSVIDTPANRDAMGSEQAHTWVKPETLAEVICMLAAKSGGGMRGAVVPVYGDQ